MSCLLASFSCHWTLSGSTVPAALWQRMKHKNHNQLTGHDRRDKRTTDGDDSRARGAITISCWRKKFELLRPDFLSHYLTVCASVAHPAEHTAWTHWDCRGTLWNPPSPRCDTDDSSILQRNHLLLPINSDSIYIYSCNMWMFYSTLNPLRCSRNTCRAT